MGPLEIHSGWRVCCRGNFISSQGKIKFAFAVGHVLKGVGNHHIAAHAVELGGSAIDPVVLLNGEFERAQGLVLGVEGAGGAVEVHHVLDGAFAEGLGGSDNNGTAVVLQGSGDDLRG